jgi:osmotically-inducible protein OsmY
MNRSRLAIALWIAACTWAGPAAAEEVTVEDQSQSSEDIRITSEIRKAIMDEDGLSFKAKNAKIITAGGAVTLRGEVSDEAERTRIAQIASTCGPASVDNQLEVIQG